MKNEQVVIGHTYQVTVSGRRRPVYIHHKYRPDSRQHHGWIGVNDATGREVYIASGRRLQRDITDNTKLIEYLKH